MNAIWGFLLALFLALTGEYLAGVLAPALGLQKGAISGIMMAILLGILVNNLFKLPEVLAVVDELPVNDLGKLPRRDVAALIMDRASP